jgi:dipeptidyl aminopeptidase/acylaminoacyl peptidase
MTDQQCGLCGSGRGSAIWWTGLGLVLWMAGTAIRAEEVMTPQRVAELRMVGEAVVSPDGQHVAYTLLVPRRVGVDDDGEAWAELWVLGAREGGNRRPFVTGKVNVSQVGWTPDGRGIAFLAKRGEDKQRSLYVIPADGGEARRAAGLKSDISGYSFSTDGKRVVLMAASPEDEARRKLKEKGFRQEIYEEDWRPTQLWVRTLFGEDTEPMPEPLRVEGSVRAVEWSPVDDRLAAAVTPTPSVDDGLIRQQLWIVDSVTGEVVGEVEHQGKLGAFRWSPDGRRLAMIAAEDLHDPSAGRLMVVEATGGKPRDLLPRLAGEVRQLAWVDAETLCFGAALGVDWAVGVVKAEGREAAEWLHGPGKPIVGSLSLSQGGQVAALVASGPVHPPELFLWTLAEGRVPVRKTDSNPWLAEMRLAVQEVVRHKARDGLDLEGVLIRPLGEEPDRRYPLILSVHGGPEAHVSDGWITGYGMPGQVAAARGFAVFYPNYRGSTGRGVEFSKLGQGDAAGREFDDLVDAVDHLIEIGLVDRERVGVTGGSYGGYATAWCSTRYSERFAAGVMFVGISDKISKVGTTDIADEEYLVHARKRVWEEWQFMLDRSPIYHAGKARTPLLILHGADDPRVHVSQSREMYRHMKLRSAAPVRLVLYPGEGHGNRKAAARFDYHLRMQQWFEHYLLGSGGEPPAYELEYGLPQAEP